MESNPVRPSAKPNIPPVNQQPAAPITEQPSSPEKIKPKPNFLENRIYYYYCFTASCFNAPWLPVNNC